MKKLKLGTKNLAYENIKKLSKIFPNVVKEGKVDFELLKQVLSDHLIEDCRERYGLNWVGKKESILKANSKVVKTLRPIKEKSINFENTKNLYIEGDNFEVLKVIGESYLNKIKMIYIDPPYNTGKDFIYKDNFSKSKDEYLKEVESIDEDGVKLYKNTNSNGRFHSDWLSMMYERLLVARDLLGEDGVIFISIDDNEVHNLRHLCDDVFGEENFVANLSVENNPKGRKNSDYIAVSNDYILIYAKQFGKSYFVENIPKNIKDLTFDEETGRYIHSSGKRVLVGENSFNKEVSNFNSNKHYSVYYNANTKDFIIKKEKKVDEIDTNLIKKGYKRYISIKNNKFIENTYTSDKLKELFQQKALEFKNDKIFEKNFNTFVRLKSILTNQKYEAFFNNKKIQFVLDVKTTSAGIDMKKLFNTNDAVFPMSKNIGLIKILITLFSEKDFIILDFFSGSATTAHAVMELNAQDCGNRQFIMVQIPELTDEKSEAYKAGYKTICDIGRERIIRAGKKIKEDFKDKEYIDSLDFGFRYFKIDSSNFKEPKDISEITQEDILYTIDNIKPDRNELDLLFEVILNLGLELTLKIESKEILGKRVYFLTESALHKVEENYLIATFDEGVDEHLAKELASFHPAKIVLKDNSFYHDRDKINFEQTIKELSPETDIWVV